MVAGPQLYESPIPSESQPLLPVKLRPDTVLAINDDLKAEEPDPSTTEELKTLLKLVYPVVMTSALEYLPGLACIVLTGHLNSPNTQQYVDAATLSTMFMNISANTIGYGLTSALDTLCSQAYGARRYDKISLYFQAGLVVIFACLGPILLFNWYAETFLLLMGQDPEVSRLAQRFSRWTVLGVPFLFLYELVRKVLQAQNIMQPLVVIAGIGNSVNLVVGYLLAYHTSMGFEGIALAQSLGNMMLPLLLVPYFCYRPQHLSLWWHGWKIHEAVTHVGLFLRLGLPGMLVTAMEWWAFELLTWMAGILPNAVVAVSAHAVTVNVESMIYMIFTGLAVAANIRVGNCLGANKPKQAKLTCRVVLTLTLAISLTFSVSIFVMRHSIPSLFVNNQESIDRAASVLAVWAPLIVFDGLNTVVLGVFRGAGKQKVAATVNAVAYYVFGIPVAAMLAFRFVLGVEGLWLGFELGVFASTLPLFYMLFERWTWVELANDAQKRTAE